VGGYQRARRRSAGADARGAQVNGDTYPNPPLFAASGGGSTATIRLLLGHGADPNRRATIHNPGATALHEAACRGQLEALEALLDAGADPGVRDPIYDSTPAGWANEFGKHAARELLERRGG
jgi:ankyrin repeat protein